METSSSSATIGLAVGVPIGVLGLAAAGLMFFWSRRKVQVAGQQMAMQQAPPNDVSIVGYTDANEMNGYRYKTPEPLEIRMPPAEVPGEGTPPVHELPAGHRQGEEMSRICGRL